MASVEEYEATVQTAQVSTTTMWICLALFIFVKVCYNINTSVMWAIISFSQLIIHFSFIESVSKPAPAQLVFTQFNMMVNFSPD